MLSTPAPLRGVGPGRLAREPGCRRCGRPGAPLRHASLESLRLLVGELALRDAPALQRLAALVARPGGGNACQVFFDALAVVIASPAAREMLDARLEALLGADAAPLRARSLFELAREAERPDLGRQRGMALLWVVAARPLPCHARLQRRVARRLEGLHDA